MLNVLSSLTAPASTAGTRGLVGAAAKSVAVLQTGRGLAAAMRSRRLSRVATVAAGAYFAYAAFRALQASLAQREQVRAGDRALDERLEESFPASDASASY